MGVTLICLVRLEIRQIPILKWTLTLPPTLLKNVQSVHLLPTYTACLHLIINSFSLKCCFLNIIDVTLLPSYSNN